MGIDVALVVGHRRGARGASGNGVNEWDFWMKHAKLLAEEVKQRGLSVKVVERADTRNGYRELPGRVLALEPRCAVSLHLNSASAAATGTETLTAAMDVEDQKLGGLVQRGMVASLGLRDRGVKPIGRRHRGAPLLFGLWTVPCCLIEPCFVSNPKDVARLHDRLDAMLAALAEGIASYVKP